MTWLAIAVNTLAIFFIGGVLILHIIDTKNHDEWDDDE